MRLIAQNLSPESTPVEKVSFSFRWHSVTFEGVYQKEFSYVMYPIICENILSAYGKEHVIKFFWKQKPLPCYGSTEVGSWEWEFRDSLIP